MKRKILSIIALLAVMVALTGAASAASIDLLRDGIILGNPIPVKNNDNFNLALQVSALRSQDLNTSNTITLVQTGCTDPIITPTQICDAINDITLKPLKASFIVTSIPITIQSDSAEVIANVPLSRQPGTEYGFQADVGPFGPPINPASASRSLIIVGGFISGTKFNDSDGNGIRGTTEPGLANWTIILRDEKGTEVNRTQTDANGNYEFKGPSIIDTQGHIIFLGFRGNFTVEEVPQAGWKQTAPAPVPPGIHNVTIDANNVTGLDFGNRIPPPPKLNISGRKFNDLNNNSVEDAGEPGLSGWQIDLNFTNGTVFRMTTTASDGSYKFENVDAGTYIVQEVQQTGWIQTFPTPVPPGTYTITLTNASKTGLDFGNFQIPGKPGKVVGWGNLGSKGSFKIWVYSHFLPSGTMEFTDTINKVTIEATRLDSVTTDIMATPKTGTITGMATVNGAGPYAFTVKVVDAASPGAGKDMFTIDVSSPTPYHNSGTLTMGDVNVVK